MAPNELEVTSSIARGTTIDLRAASNGFCDSDRLCDVGVIHIDHSNFATRAPLATAPDGVVITEGAGNQSGDPLFVDAANDDYRLRTGSPAIDAGAPQELAPPSDLDGRARVQGSAPDLGAFEASPPAGSGPGGAGDGSSGTEGASRPAVLSRLRATPSHFHVGGRRAGTTIRFRLDRASSVTVTFERVLTGHHKGPRCLTGQKRGPRCTILRSAGHVTVRNGQAGANTVL